MAEMSSRDAELNAQYHEYIPPIKMAKTCSSNSTKEFDMEELAISYSPAPFGPDMLGTSSFEAYLNILSMARIQTPEAKTVDNYAKLLSVLNDLHVDDGNRTYSPILAVTRPPLDDPEKSQSDESRPEMEAEVRKIYTDLDKCFDAINEQECKLNSIHTVYLPSIIRSLARSLDRLLRFMTNLRLTLHRWLCYEQLDEETFKQLFCDFTWIFGISFRLDHTGTPLIVKGEALPTTPDLVFEDLSGPWSPTGRILTIAVAEVKKTAIPRSTSSQSQSHDLRPRHSSPESDLCSSSQANEDVTTVLPDKLRRQHACQLVQDLPYTRLRNTECMLGFIIQATKVRLTCLVMTEDHLRDMKLPDFDPSGYTATIYYTRAYDMLHRSDRKHLTHIFAAISGINKYNKVEFDLKK